jgi:hypothetical protein
MLPTSSSLLPAGSILQLKIRLLGLSPMVWRRVLPKQGAHLMLQTRTRVLDGTLRGKFEQWYPGLAANNSAPQLETAMAA